MFRVKICGITNVEDALAAVDAGADAIGLNFYEKSPRYVSLEQAAEICNAVDGRVKCVGVFVNPPRSFFEGNWKVGCIDGVQLHGDEPPRVVATIVKLVCSPRTSEERELFNKLVATSRRTQGEEETTQTAAFKDVMRSAEYRNVMRRTVIRARRMTDDGVTAIAADLDACRKAGGAPGSVLVDAFTPGRYGGTGETVSWARLSDYKTWLGDVPLILAGGLTPENVAEAIRIVRPYGVDVASGVESSAGKKDRDKVKAFVEAARSAL